MFIKRSILFIKRSILEKHIVHKEKHVGAIHRNFDLVWSIGVNFIEIFLQYPQARNQAFFRAGQFSWN